MKTSITQRLWMPLTTYRRIPPILWASAPGWTVVSSFLITLEITLGLLSLYLIKTLVDALTATLTGVPAHYVFEPILWKVGYLGAATLGFLAARSISSLAREAQCLAVVDHIDRLIHQAAVQADLSFFESPQYFDTLQRARQSGTQRPAQVATNALNIVKNVIMLVAVIGLMLSIDWRLLPILAVAIAPALWVRVHFTKVLYQWKKQRTELERRAGYLDWLMTSDTHAKELRLNQLGDYLKAQYSRIKGGIRSEQLNINQRQTGVELTVGLVASAVFFLALGYLTYQTALGQTSVGDLVLFLLIFQRAQSMGQELVNQISKLYEDHLYLGLLFEFLDLKPQLTAMGSSTQVKGQAFVHNSPMAVNASVNVETQISPPWDNPPRIEFEGVHFKYPGCEDDVLSDINLTLPSGQVVALVGANGSGKTSLIKLLTRLYDPTQGRIIVNGQDVRSYEPEVYRRLFSVVFQDFACYADSASNNIRFGDIALPPESVAIRRAAERAGAVEFIEALPSGFETMLSRMFKDGVDLSRGQWQKIALARALMERAKIIIFDEPSSALDPNAEADLFENFKKRLEGRSALIIAHRLSTIRLADWIVVLHDGRIVEAGTHEMLAEQDGVYAKAFERQGRFYLLANP